LEGNSSDEILTALITVESLSVSGVLLQHGQAAPAHPHREWNVKINTRTAAILAVAIAVVGCSDNATAPSPIRKASGIAADRQNPLDLSNRPDLRAAVASEVTFHMKDGTIHKSKFSQKIKAHFIQGLARATVEAASLEGGDAFASLTKGTAEFAQFSSTDGSYTPVLATTAGALALNYHTAYTDSVGNVFDYYAWAPYPNMPISDSWGYQNGVLTTQLHANWSAVYGGYVLTSQTVGSYYPDGVLAATIVSTVGSTTGSGIAPTNDMLPEGFKEPIFAALDKIGCWLGPRVAYADGDNCYKEAGVFAGETFVLGAATYYGGPFAEKAAVAAAWWLGWPLWTTSAYDLAKCLNGTYRGGNKCQTNPKLCTGGAGSTF